MKYKTQITMFWTPIFKPSGPKCIYHHTPGGGGRIRENPSAVTPATATAPIPLITFLLKHMKL